jgi:hypothetical protein
MICDTWFNIRKQFDATMILSFDYWAAVLATFPQIGQFFSNFWSQCKSRHRLKLTSTIVKIGKRYKTPLYHANKVMW